MYLVPRAGSFFDPDYSLGKGASHGTPRIYDRAVPMLVFTPGEDARPRTIDAPTDASAYARTLSALLRIEPPQHARQGADLSE